MKKMFKKPKIIVSIILITITIALGIVNTFATADTFRINGVNGNTEVGVNSTVTLNNARNEWGGGTNQLFADNPELFCIEHGEHIGVNPTYKVTKKHEVQDPMLIYILNMDNRGGKTEQERKLINNDLKQQLIWWYLNNNSNDDVSKILGGVHNETADVPDELKADFEAAKTAARNYKNYIEGAGISISETKKINENGIDKLSVTVTGTFESWDIYINNSDTPYQANISSTQKTIKIPLSELNNTNGYVVVHVKAKIKPKTATVFILSNANDQRLMYVVPGEGAVRETDKIEEKVQFDVNVSLQKYITKVNNHNIAGNTSLTNRKNTMTKPEEAPDEDQDTAVKVNISKRETANSTIYKSENTVKIKAGDSVTYRIHVYNNSEVAALNVRVAEVLPHSDTNDIIYAEIEKITTGTSTTDIKNEWQQDSSKHYIYRYKIPSIPANGEVYFDVTLKFNRYSSNRLLNTAWISSSNVGGYRTLDRDFVKMEDKYEVSLEKYVSHVNDVPVSDREGHRYNENATGITNKDLYKKDANVGVGPVNVNVGDIVTFKIKLKNESTTSKVKITEIYDRFTYINDGSRQLELVNGTGNITSENGTDIEITKYDYDLTEAGQEAEAAYERYRIKFKDAKTLNPGQSVYVTIQFRVISNSGSAVLNYSNKAGILKLQNENNIEVPDSNGTEDNYDMDWLVAKQYKVSLEKFVSQVNGVDVTPNRAGHPTYNENGFSKVNNKVEVEAGDLVTFTIRLKNESDSDYADVKITKIYDEFNDTQFKKLQLEGAINGNGGGNKRSETKILVPDGSGDEYLTRYEIEFENAITLTKKQSTDVTITFKVLENSYYDNVLYMNKAGIIEIKNTAGDVVEDSDGEFNNHDKDYLWLNRLAYSVSLEKYVTEVTDGAGNNKVTYDNRQGKRYNNQISEDQYVTDGDEDIINHNTYKPDNKVPVEPGDKVTFTIKLKNTGDKPVKITQIYDTFKNHVDGYRLEYDSEYGIQGNGNGEVIDNSYKKDDPTWSKENLDRYLINFENATMINQGESVYVTIRFKVIVPINLTNDKTLTLYNKAAIVETKNRNNAVVKDSDGALNNHDMDYLKPTTYAVSLEKYVSKVNDVNINSSRRGKAQHKYDNDESTLDQTKYDSPVTVLNGDLVTYTIKLTNDGDRTVKITNVADYLPNGVKYNGTSYTGNLYCTAFEHKDSIYDENGNYNAVYDNGQTDYRNRINHTEIIELSAGESKTFEITVEVTEPNISNNILKNVAEITAMRNRNDCGILDTTGNNNKDADYIQLDFGELEELTSYTVVKKWQVEEGLSSPAQVTVKLYKVEGGNEIDLGMPSVELSESNNWSYTWTGLPKGVDYIARELSEDGNNIVKDSTKYNENTTTTYNETGNTMTITNKQTPPPPPPPPEREETEFTVEKVWEDNNNLDRPTEIKVRLYKIKNNGDLERVGDIITLDSTNWSYTWTGLDKYDDDNNLIKYTAREIIIEDGWFGSTKETIVEEGEQYNENYKAFYLQEQNKTTITNKMEEDEESNDLAISGIVWNDLALDKTQNKYDGLKNEQESVLSGVKVMLYRVDKGVIAMKYTNENGEYSFTNVDLKDSTLPDNEKFIKGPRVVGTDRWTGEYYSYYVIFEYDGIIYTSTVYNSYTSENELDSNAREKLNNEEYDGKVDESRTAFNNDFSVINNAKGIEYSTKNESGYIPQSIHKYNEDTMGIQSSTSLIGLRNDKELEEQLKHVNLGLRGRDIFDLELTSDVYSTKVIVNNVDGQYNYNSNKVTVRRTDANNYNYIEDTANTYLDSSKYEGESWDQGIRETDVNIDATKTEGYKTPYSTTGLSIEVTYKITVTNASNTAGTATKIINYYDDAYTFVKAYDSNGSELTTAVNTSGTGYKSVTVTTPGTNLNQSEKMEIYVVYTLNDAVNKLKDIEKLATYNMAEITEYTTKCAEGQTEYTRGLIDKDSAPGSGSTEKVRLHPDLIGNVSTVEYYFGENDLSVLKYEDDTYATPTLYFIVTDENNRTITGTVFRDETVVDATTRIKTGNGKLDEGEVGVFGATVQLIEQVDDGKVRYETTTNTEGKFEFTGFLPGNYIIRYYYGDTANTVLLNQSGNVNAYSFNGEDYQSTNNAYNLTVKDESGNELTTNLLSTAENFWYAYNEGVGVSTAIDNSNRRKTVSANVLDTTIFTDTNKTNSDEVMIRLNEARKGELSNERLNTSLPKGTLIEQTYMFADTELMVLTVEKTELVTEGENQVPKQKEQFSEYKISNMNFGIAEVPVTIIDLQKEVQSFTIMDSVGQNVLAAASKNDNGTWNEDSIKGDVIVIDGEDEILVQIEDEKLQGARLQITYSVNSNMNIELNYDGTAGENPTITNLVDIIDNNLSYNSELENNSEYWEVRGPIQRPTESSSIVDIDKHSTILKVKDTKIGDLNTEGGIPITLERVLSSTDSTIEEIITSTVDSSEYNNIVEIMAIEYNGSAPDRIRIPDRYIIIPGVQHDTAAAETIVIAPPTGDSSISTVYYIIAGISLVVLAVGVFGIKKFVVNTKK